MHSLGPHGRNAIDPVRVTAPVIACPSSGSGIRLAPASVCAMVLYVYQITVRSSGVMAAPVSLPARS